VYGNGLVDAAAALRPVNPVMSNGLATAPVDGNVMIVGNTFGGLTAASMKQALGEVTVLDQFGRDYTGDMSTLVVQAARENPTWIDRRLQAQMNARTGSFTSPVGSVVVGATAFDTGLRDAAGVPVLRGELTNAQVAVRLSDRFSLTGGFNSDHNVTTDILGLAPTSDAVLAYSPWAQSSIGINRRIGEGNLALSAYAGGAGDIAAKGTTLQFLQGRSSLKLGMIDEKGSVFGTPVGTGMLRFGNGARTVFLEAASSFDLGRWRFDGFGSLGGTRLRLPGDTLITDADIITTARFGLIASRPALAGRLSFGLAQPLVVIGGKATLTVGDAYSLNARNLVFERRAVDLSSALRPQLTIGYEKIGARSNLRLGAASDIQARDIRAVGTWTVRFGGND
jgi:hypothetical protein